ncbi:acetylglutamate kinase [Candidatus Omnitrophota bacterium]
MKRAIQKADILIEALPYIKKFQHKIVVIKCGGRQLLNKEVIGNVLQDIIFMNCVGLNPVLVHGGGPSINEKLRKLGKRIEFHQGYRVTDKHTLKVVTDELARLNERMTAKISQLGAKAKGFSGIIGKVIKARQLNLGQDIGFVGQIASVNSKLLKESLKNNFIPVISPLGIGIKGQVYNINADLAAAEIAIKLGARKLMLLTDTQGIMRDQGDPSSLISTLKVSEVAGLLKRGVIQTGMIPKVEACVAALKKDVRKTHIIDGSIPRSLLLEIFTDQGVGTQIVK